MPAVPVRHGMFAWADLSTTDPDAATDFYREVFGWDADAMPAGDMGTYTMLRRNGGDIAGLGGQSPEMRAAGVPPAWNSYVTVDDVDAVTARARELGGNVLSEPFDVMDVGRMSVVQDPSGGVLCLWTPRAHQGSAVFNEHGAITWNELATRDRDAAARFYGELLGWTWEKIDTPGGPYLMAMNGDRRNAGILQMNEKWPADLPPHYNGRVDA